MLLPLYHIWIYAQQHTQISSPNWFHLLWKNPGILWKPELQLQAVALTLLGGAFLLGAAIVLAIFLEAAGEFFNLKLRKFDTIWCLNGHAGR